MYGLILPILFSAACLSYSLQGWATPELPLPLGPRDALQNPRLVARLVFRRLSFQNFAGCCAVRCLKWRRSLKSTGKLLPLPPEIFSLKEFFRKNFFPHAYYIYFFQFKDQPVCEGSSETSTRVRRQHRQPCPILKRGLRRCLDRCPCFQHVFFA